MKMHAAIGREIELLGAMDAIVTQVDGVPRGFDLLRWPVCRSCNRRQTFLLQIDLKSPIKLAKRYRWAYVFACDDPANCDPFLENSGANAVLLQSEREASENDSPCSPIAHSATTAARYFTFESFAIDDQDTDDTWIEDFVGEPVLYLGVAPDYYFDEITNCPQCGGEMALVAQFENGSACFVTICKAECQDNAACFLW